MYGCRSSSKKCKADTERRQLEAAAGGPIVIIFHSVRQSRERYANFVDGWRP